MADDKKSIRMILNGQFHSFLDNETHALGHILEIAMDKLKYMSEDAIRNWIDGALCLGEEMLEWDKNIPLKKRLTVYRKSLEHSLDRTSLINLFVNMALSCGGLGTLSGFGMANVSQDKGRMKKKASIWTNPEKRSYRLG